MRLSSYPKLTFSQGSIVSWLAKETVWIHTLENLVLTHAPAFWKSGAIVSCFHACYEMRLTVCLHHLQILLCDSTIDVPHHDCSNHARSSTSNCRTALGQHPIVCHCLSHHRIHFFQRVWVEHGHHYYVQRGCRHSRWALQFYLT